MSQTTQTIFSLAVILFSTNITRALSIKAKIPPVVGLIILGKILGPSLLNVVELDVTIKWIAQIGILFLVFSAGVQTNLKKLREESKEAFFPALGGIVIPLITGFTITYLFNHSLKASIIVGVIFAAASISIPLMTLIDINRFRSIESRCIVNSAIINDIFSIVVISIIFSLILNHGNNSLLYAVLLPLAKVIVYFIVSYLIGKYLIINIFTNSKKLKLDTSLLSLSIAIIFIYAWFAEILGLEAVIGALLSGFFIGQTEARHSIDIGIAQVGKSFFVDVFFVSIGLGLNLRVLSFQPLFLVLFIVMAVLSKFIGSFGGAIISKFDSIRSLRIGVGLIPRGEISLIIAAAAYQRGFITVELMSTVTIMVVVSSVIAPFLIKTAYAKTKKETFTNHKH